MRHDKHPRSWQQLARIVSITSLTLALAAGCTTMNQSGQTKQEYSLTLDYQPDSMASSVSKEGTLVVSPIQIASPYHRKLIYYQEQPYKLSAFAYNEWADIPEKMLDEQLISMLTRANTFDSVAPISAPIAGDYRLDVQITRMMQDFTSTPSTFVIDASAQLYDINNDKLSAQTQLNATVKTTEDTPEAGVVAANQALGQISQSLVRFLSTAP